MPTYAYRCADCGHAFDIQQSFSDDALTVCPECGGTLRKVFSAVGVVFKGSGFYRNDSRSSNGSKSSSSTTSAAAPKAADGAGSSASAPATSSSTSTGSAASGASTPASSSSTKAAS